MSAATKKKINAFAGENPYLRNISRAPYELGNLLRALPECISETKKHEPAIYQMAEAAAHHADNATNTLLFGLESIGKLVTKAGLNGEYPFDSSDLTALGELIQHISVEIQFLRSVEDDMREVLRGGV